MARKKKTIGYRVKPPYIHLREALGAITRIYEEAGGSVSEDQLSSIVGNTVGSSSFRLKVQALKNYQLISQGGPGQRIGLSDLARRIVGATSPEERAEALREAFLNVENFKKLHEMWAGKLLPVGEFFLNAIREHCRVPLELTKQWKDSFMNSADAAGLLQERPDGKIQLRVQGSEPMRGPAEEELMEEPAEEAVPTTRRSLDRPAGDLQRFQVPLLEGRTGIVELPRGWTDSDIRKMIEVIRVMFLWDKEGEK